MIKINPGSINDLLALKAAGVPVTLTSHPGNASLYKLSLWKCGIPETLWDVTCCVADANNWPMFRLKGGQAELIIDAELYQKIRRETSPTRRYVPAYQKAAAGARLGRLHVSPCEKLFPRAISSCSRLLLSQLSNVKEVFGFLAEERPEVFGRFITPDGIQIPIHESGLDRTEFADSFVNVLRELDHLLFSDEPITTKGGACYDGIMVPLATYLAQYWQTGRLERYDISGPDMINYATKPEHQKRLTDMLQFLHRWNPKLVPYSFSIRMLPGTVARIGYISGHPSEEIMLRKRHALESSRKCSGCIEDEVIWPVQINPATTKYFSQHDLLGYVREPEGGAPFFVDEFWQDIHLENMREQLCRANSMLRIRPQQKAVCV